MKFVKFSLISLLVIVVVATSVVAFSLGSIVKKGIAEFAPEILGVPVSVEHVGVSLLSGSAQISGLTIANPQGFKEKNALYLGKISLSLEPLSIFSDTIVINAINILSPEITYELGKRRTNIDALRSNIAKATKSTKKSSNAGDSSSASNAGGESKNVVIKQVVLSGAKVSLAVAGVDQKLEIPEIKIQNIGTKDKPASFAAASKAIISPIVESLTKVQIDAIPGMIKDRLEGAVDKAIDKALPAPVKDIGGAIKGLF